MKVLMKKMERDGGGTMTLHPEDAEDMWHIYNIVHVGDEIEASTTRKVVSEKGNQRLNVRLRIEVSKIDYDPESGIMRLNGKTVKDHKDVPLHSFHTMQIEPDQTFDIYKDEWDQFAIDQIMDSADFAKKSELAAIVLQPGLAHLCLMTESMTVLKEKVEIIIPKKRRGMSTDQDKAIERFFKHIYAKLDTFDLEKLKAILIAGPGQTPQQFYDFMLQEAERAKNVGLIKEKAKFLVVHASSGHLHSLQEALNDPKVKSDLADTRYGREVKAMERFFNSLNENDLRAWYGIDEVRRAAKLEAIETLMVTDSLYRSDNLEERKEFVDLVEEVRAQNVEVLVFSSKHQSGEQLNNVSGVACLLLYPLDLDEEE